ncbi:hypothetical protein NOC27_2848 [Nitrosococcus oceani AFC27]|nr:hypothetical protein NOC27_2848 [Nitrosococcus oceani AFC27]
MPLSRARALRLQSPTQTVVALAHTLHGRTTERPAIGISGHFGNSKINTNKTRRVYGGCFGCVDDDQQKESTLHKHQVGLSFGTMPLYALVLAHLYRNRHAPLHRYKAGSIQTLKAQYALVIHHGTRRLKEALLGFISLVSFNDFGDGANSQLGRQTKLLPNIRIHKFLQLKFRGALFSKSHFCNGVTSVIKNPHGLFQGRVLSSIRKQFDLERCLHSDLCYHKGNASQLSSYIGRFLPALNGEASALKKW